MFAHQRLQMVAVFALFFLSAAAGGPPNSPARPQRAAFTFATVQRFAQERAARPYRNRSPQLPEALAKLSYDQYRDIRFRRPSALWSGRALFEAQFFHRGSTFDRRVSLFEVSAAGVRSIPYSAWKSP